MVIDHIGFTVRDYEASKRFYTTALAPLGIRLLMEVGGAAGFGANKPEFWIAPRAKERPAPTHVALAAANRAQVRAFHQAALAAGGKDNGAPGIRAIYHPDYYGAFVLDPDGHNIEAVCHRAE